MERREGRHRLPAIPNPTAEVTNVLSAAECAAFEDLWHDDLLRLLDGSKVDAEANFTVDSDRIEENHKKPFFKVCIRR